MKRRPYRYLLYLGLLLMQGMVAVLPRRLALRLGGFFGRLAFAFARRERERTIQHLTWAFDGEKSEREIRDLAQRVFCHFAHVAVDVFRFPKLTLEAVDRLIEEGEGLDRLNRALEEGRGVIILTGHFGNWELMGAFLRFHGYQGAAVGRRIYYEKFNEILLELRGKAAFRTIYQDAPAREFLKVLKQNQMLGILADQDVDRLDGLFVPFFGKPAYTLTAPVKLALATGAPIVPTFLVREGERYRLLVEEPLRVERLVSREDTILEFTEQWSRVMEAKIRDYPEQWVWFHRRWKTQPQEYVEASASPVQTV